MILRNPPFGFVSKCDAVACTNDKSRKVGKHCNPISYFPRKNEKEIQKPVLGCNTDKETDPWN